jgi:hypothetical protein
MDFLSAGISALSFPDIVREIEARIPDSADAFLVGGAVRDAVLGRPIHDIDITVRGDGVALARRMADALGGACYPLDLDRKVGRVITTRGAERFTIDFASLRGNDIHSDLAARDFTINAMAIPLHRWDQPLDPLSGASDLIHKQIRVCSDSSIQADPVRTIRAIRLAAHLDFQLEPATRELIRIGAPGLVRVSAERIRDEFFRILGGRKTAAAIRAAYRLGILPYIIPEVVLLDGLKQPDTFSLDGWNQTVLSLEKLETILELLAGESEHPPASDLWMGMSYVQLGRFRSALRDRLQKPLSDDRTVRSLLFFAALMHDIGKSEFQDIHSASQDPYSGYEALGAEQTAQRAIALRLSSDECQFVAGLVRHHARPLQLQDEHPISRRAIYRFFQATGPVGVEACLLALADVWATNGPALPADEWERALQKVRSLWEGYFEHATEMIRPVVFLTGNDLIHEFNVEPGPAIGELLDALREAQAAGEIHSREEALTMVARGLGRAP